MSVLAQLLGGDEVKAKLDRMDKATKRAVRNAVRRGATLQARAIKSNLKRRRTGLLAKSIGSKVKDSKGGNRVTALSGPRRGFKVKISKRQAQKLEGVRETKKGSKTIKLSGKGNKVKEGDVIDAVRYAHLIEGGHKKGKGKSAAPAFPFMKPAFEQTKGEVQNMVRQAVREVMQA